MEIVIIDFILQILIRQFFWHIPTKIVLVK
jgi:hypothetical protein